MMIDGIEWQIFDSPLPYPEALARMEARAAEIAEGRAPEAIWLMEHPALLTSGHGGEAPPPGLDLPVLAQKRGGGLQYYGPGLRMAYAMLRVADHARDIACFVRGLEKWAIATLAEFNLRGELRPGQLGVWVPPAKEGGVPRQICSLSVRVRRGISLQGLSLHLEPDLAALQALRSAGEGEATSLVALGYPVSFIDLDLALQRSFAEAMASVSGSCTIS